MQTCHTTKFGEDQDHQSSTALPLSPPQRSLEQRRSALRRANVIRCTRAAMKRTVKEQRDGTPLIAQLSDPSEDFESMKVFDLLQSLPKVGRVKANKMLRVAQVSPSKTVGGLSDRQRRELRILLPVTSAAATGGQV